MSARNWATCPQCKSQAKSEHADRIKAWKASYGKVSPQEDKDAREFALSLIAKIDSMQQNGDELRKRIDTIGRAVEKINESMKSA